MKFVGLQVKHKTFGEGEVVEVSPRTNELDYMLTVSFGEVEKKFVLKSFNKFLSTDDNEFNDYINKLLADEKAKKVVVAESLENNEPEKKLKPVNFYNYDDKKRVLVKEHWQRMYAFADEFRFPYQDRPIMLVDKNMVYLSSVVALKHNDLNTELSELLYLACEKNTKKTAPFLNLEWRYATKDELEYILSTFNDDTDRT